MSQNYYNYGQIIALLLIKTLSQRRFKGLGNNAIIAVLVLPRVTAS